MSYMDHVALELAMYLLKRLKEQVKIEFHVNRLHKSSHPEAQNSVGIVVPLDGWHFPRSTLDTFPDPKLAYDRRGAHWTFNGGGYVSFVERLRDPQAMLDNGIVTAPSFSHSLKDPVMDDIVIHPHHRIVIIEGLYVFLNIEPWIKAGRTLDERWFLRVDPVQGKERLCKRHVETGVAGSWEEAIWRAENNDIPNGKFIEANMLPPTREIPNKEDHDLGQSA
ncbi:hypothetical protein Clacol_008094 [Clathrus columnatus]|uniref:Phosphoribulokinase/uridine kinase domain-containing protein n=1 Tax=Clathrus columnatus TaxID=1419009 RepID=A0AAV5AJA3_9AGAM|nr:hypothetical protein Clacol_008094 [Clathrus columnatus]